MRAGSEKHEELFCRSFLSSHVQRDPPELRWPDLSEAELARLRRVPVWTAALHTERNAGVMLARFAEAEPTARPERRACIDFGYAERVRTIPRNA